jgi:hypothetical protein
MPFEAQDELEAFLLHFLLYRREKSKHYKGVPIPPAKQPLDMGTPLLPAEIGKGWPHYKTPEKHHGESEAKRNPVPEAAEECPKNEIIGVLQPIAKEMVTRFGSPENPNELAHLNHQVIAKAMALPMVGEGMRAEENRPWGRVPLMQAVAELLILSLVNGNRVGKGKDAPFA